MPTFWNTADRDDICRRVERLTPDATARWGKFTPAKMLAHLNDAMRMATGDLAVASKNSPIRYWPLKQLIIYVFPFPKGAPTAPELLARCDNADLQTELSGLPRHWPRAWRAKPAGGSLAGSSRPSAR